MGLLKCGIMSTKLLVINDPHISHIPPLGRTFEYENQIMDKLDECWDIAMTNGCNAALLSGDLFNKWRGTIPYRLTSRVDDWLRRAPCIIIATPGNHDLTYGGMAELDMMPFGLLKHRMRIATKGNPQALDLTECDVPVVIIGRPWEPYIDTQKNVFNLTAMEKKLADRFGAIMMVHGSILPPGDTRPYPYHSIDKLKIYENVDLVLSGHIHEDLGIHQLDNGLWFANVGSLGRVSRTEDNMTRQPQVLIVTVDNDGIDFERVVLKSTRPAEEVFFDKELNVVKELKEFSSALADGLEMEETPIEELIAKYTKGESDEVVVRLREYLTGVTE